MPGLFMIAVSMGMLAAAPDYPVKPVPFTAVRVDQGFWAPRLETNRTVTIPFDFKKCEETGRIKNFAVAGRLEPGEFKGIFFDDSDVYKVIEGASYSLSLHPDAELERYLDDVIAKIAAAQEDDGYLYTYRTSNANNQEKIAKDENLRDGRWAHLEYNHELYNLGHLYEAAVAHYQATGKRSLLDVALKSADLVCSVFGPDKRIDVPGHEEIEMGLVKLYRVTGDEKYLRQAKFFVDARGSAKRAKLYGPNLQDHEPVLQQEKVVGHAVRAGYLFAGMTDVAALTGDAGYVETANRLWQDVVSTKLSITGGVGARREGEAYGAAYELPNKEAYNETCAAIALALWNQ
ncbi:MAG: glycoside hydrolase family 127 protein, partial [Candidatus Hydrogenedentes bacterium]|nr:glycoside hydrolase family 127 protein [Candidatus Hydrogenedentota bacterium]